MSEIKKTDLIDIEPRHLLLVHEILQKHVPQYEVWVFGSRAKGIAKKHSDLDIAILTTEPLCINANAELNEAFQESDLPYKVDIVDWACISETFKNIIKKDKVVLKVKS